MSLWRSKAPCVPQNYGRLQCFKKRWRPVTTYHSSQVCQALCPFSVLEVSPSANEHEIKKAYRRLALQYHPDVNSNGNAAMKFQAVQEAYELLSGRSRGKEINERSESFSWDFHDWYWKFRMNHTWGKQQSQVDRNVAQTRIMDLDNNGQLKSQLAGLQQRAAIRSQKHQRQTASSETQSPAYKESREAKAVNLESLEGYTSPLESEGHLFDSVSPADSRNGFFYGKEESDPFNFESEEASSAQHGKRRPIFSKGILSRQLVGLRRKSYMNQDS